MRPGKEMLAVGYIPVYESIQSLVDDHGPSVQTGTFREAGVDDDEADMRRQERDMEQRMLHGD